MSQSKKVPKYRRHSRGTAFVKFQGKTYYLGKYGTDESRKRYRRFLEQIELKTDAEKLDVSTPESRTVVQLIELYLDYAETYYVGSDGKQSGEFTSMSYALEDVDEAMGDVIAANVGPANFMLLQRHLIAKNHCRSFINKTVGRAKRMFRWACSTGLCPAEVYHRLTCIAPLQKGRTKARESEKVKPVPRSVLDATLPWMSPVIADMTQIQYLCGMRPSELCRMRACDIDRSGDVWLYRPATHKNEWRGHERVVAVPQIAQAILTPYLDRRGPNDWTFSPRDAEKVRNDGRRATAGKNRKTKCFPSEERRLAAQKQARKLTAFTRLRHAYDAASYRRAVRYAIQKAKRKGTIIPAWFPYQLRHGIATEIAQTLGQVAAQTWLGHENLETTSIYVEKQVGELMQTARLLDRHWAALAAAKAQAVSENQSNFVAG